jgi:transmembrane sensor
MLAGKLSPEETNQLLEWLNRDENAGQAATIISSHFNQEVTEDEITPEIRNALQARLPLILNAPKREKRGAVRLFLQPWFKYAAAAVLIIGATFYLRLIDKRPVPATTSTEKQIATITDIAPGGEGAILTLADGRQVVLDSLGNGTISMQTGAEVRLKDGQLVYDPVNTTGDQITYNSISTPKGRQFQLLLPDGTKVWLNAASSLKYPTHFSGNERKVEIKGEAYFEVATLRLRSGQKMPFKVILPQGGQVQVLGTHFNINAYDDDDAIKTTLLEGSVRVVNEAGSKKYEAGSKKSEVILKPGEQAILLRGHTPRHGAHALTIHHSPDLEQVVAWKNGVFNFEEATLQEVMHQLERWYDIEVVYETGIPKLEFVGKMGRDLSLNNVLRGLALNKVHFRLEGRKLVVLP